MSKHQPTSTTTIATTSKWEAKQIIDILPSYISLYKTPNPNPNPNPTPDRTIILKWFATLSPPQRVAHLTIMDPIFTQLLLNMSRHVTSNKNRHSHVTFFILPDIPATSSSDPVPLPSLLTRRSRGLIARRAESTTRRLSSSIRLFSSREDGSSRYDTSSLDTVSFREGFLGGLDDFVGEMDAVSNYGFLNGELEEWGELGLELGEMRWLKGKGYYSLEEFVANRVEVALRMAWLSSNSSGGGGRKRGVKVKEKEKEKAKNSVGLGVNLYWRKRGCVDWWDRLDLGVRRNVFRTLLGTTAKYLVWYLDYLVLNFCFDTYCHCCYCKWNLEFL